MLFERCCTHLLYALAVDRPTVEGERRTGRSLRLPPRNSFSAISTDSSVIE